MTGELLIAAGPGEWRAAWVEAGAAVELYVERGDTRPPGSIHLGRAVRLVPGLEALLVDLSATSAQRCWRCATPRRRRGTRARGSSFRCGAMGGATRRRW